MQEIIYHALLLAAKKHAGQYRKGANPEPYIVHAIRVSKYLYAITRNPRIAAAGALHDVIESSRCSYDEIASACGEDVAKIVIQVTSPKRLDTRERKELQAKFMPHLTYEAQLVKIADQIDNVIDLADNPPIDWTLEKRIEYLDLASAVVSANSISDTAAGSEAVSDFYIAEQYARKVLGSPS